MVYLARVGRRECGGMLGSQPGLRPREWTGARVLRLLTVIALSLLLSPDISCGGDGGRHRLVRRGDHKAAASGRHHRPAVAQRRTSGHKVSRVHRARRVPRKPVVRPRRPSRAELVRRPLVTSPGRLRRESDAAVRDGLSRMRDMRMVGKFRRAGLLVTVPAQAPTYYVAGVASSLRAVRPWTKSFLEATSRAFHRAYGRRLRVTSLVRTQGVQLRLLRTNLGAAPAHGPVQSTHLTGAALDISTRVLSTTQAAWLRTMLDRLRGRGAIHVVEELRQPHFHVMVRKSYPKLGRPPAAGRDVGQ